VSAHHDRPTPLEFRSRSGRIELLTVRASYGVIVVNDRVDGRRGYTVTHGPTALRVHKLRTFADACALAQILAAQPFWSTVSEDDFFIAPDGQAEWRSEEKREEAAGMYLAALEAFRADGRHESLGRRSDASSEDVGCKD